MAGTRVSKFRHGFFGAVEKTEIERRRRDLAQMDHLCTLIAVPLPCASGEIETLHFKFQGKTANLALPDASQPRPRDYPPLRGMFQLDFFVQLELNTWIR
jgi:hypothetical protein